MQNRYVGDVGDFGKYGLLRALTGMRGGGEELRMGVVWYLVPDGHGNDGNQLDYLQPNHAPRFRPCDPPLYDELRAIVEAGERQVGAVQERSILAADTAFHSKLISFGHLPWTGPATLERRLAHMRDWTTAAQAETEPCDVVFVDPDNGLEIPSTKRHEKNAPKYTFFEDLRKYVQREQSLVIYHTPGRRGGQQDQIACRLAQVRDELSVEGAFALRYHPWHPRVFFVVPASKHARVLRMRASELLSGPWGQHFDPLLHTL